METNKQQQEHTQQQQQHGASHASQSGAKKRKASKKIPKQHRVGNFRSYYTFRLGQSRQGELEDDSRLAALDKAWFCGKRGLDIGCNSGDLTIAIAKKMEPAYLLGIDVDAQLVSRARSNLKELLQQEQIKKAFDTIPAASSSSFSSAPNAVDTLSPVEKAATAVNINGGRSSKAQDDNDENTSSKQAKAASQDDSSTAVSTTTTPFANEMPLSFRLWKSPVQATIQLPKALGKATTGCEIHVLSIALATSTSFPANVVFKREDIVIDTHAGKDYDFITCHSQIPLSPLVNVLAADSFSVTKWIHLFHGDEGIKSVFAHIYKLLAPGGRFIVEPQPWKSYHKRKFTSEITAANYQKIQLRPKDFPSFLVDTIGFKKCTFLQVCRTSANGFRRPVYVVEK